MHCNNGLNNKLVETLVENKVAQESGDLKYLQDSMYDFVSTLKEIILGEYSPEFFNRYVDEALKLHGSNLDEFLKIPKMGLELRQALNSIDEAMNTSNQEFKNNLVHLLNKFQTSLDNMEYEARSPYDLAVKYGFVGTEEEWLSNILNSSETAHNIFQDAKTFADFLYKPADFNVARRLAPSVHTLDFYLDSFDTEAGKVANKSNEAITGINAIIQVVNSNFNSSQELLNSVSDKYNEAIDIVDSIEPTVIQRVEDAINNTAVEGGVLADTFVTVTANGVGAVPINLRELVGEVSTITRFGGKADYTGTPLYDGNDATRITATDNTAAFNSLVQDAISKGKRAVKIPAGHWAIKTGNLNFNNFDSLHIYGEGIDVTTLDFLKEDATGRSYVSHNASQSIATIKNGNTLEFSNMTVKATTKEGVVFGTNESPGSLVYSGKIWGFKIENVKNVTFRNVKAERFNYRGFSVTGSDSVKIIDCEGFRNVGSGFWVAFTKLLTVVGGEYAYNGIFGNTGTGYGVTANEGVGMFICRKVYAHHNYRKGLDTHGASNMIVDDCLFVDNVLYHCAMPNNAPPIIATKGIYEIKNSTMHNGLSDESEAWLRSCYQALYDNGYVTHAGSAASIQDPKGRATDIIFTGNKVLAAYCGLDIMDSTFQSYINFYSTTAKLTFANNQINMRGYGNNIRAKGGYSYSPISLNVIDWDIHNNNVIYDSDAVWQNAEAVSYTGVVYSLGGTSSSSKGVFDNNTTTINNAVLIGRTVGNSNNLTVLSGDYRFTMTNNITYGEIREDLLGRDKWFTRKAYLNQKKAFLNNNTFIIKGIAHTFDYPEGTKNNKSVTIPGATNKVSGDSLARIVVDTRASFGTVDIIFYTNVGQPDKISIWLGQSSAFPAGHVITNTSTQVEVTTRADYVDIDGYTKIEILLKSINDARISWYAVDASITSPVSSYGIEGIELL